jgi:hypothetical protein
VASAWVLRVGLTSVSFRGAPRNVGTARAALNSIGWALAG